MRPPRALPSMQELTSQFDWDPVAGKLFISGTNKEVGSGPRRQIYVGEFKYLASRILWKLYTGDDPGDLIVEHRDCNPANNSISNLRLATRTQNQANIRRRKSSTLLKGVSRTGNRFRSRIKYNGRSIYIGTYDTEEEAHKAYCKMAEELFGEFRRVS